MKYLILLSFLATSIFGISQDAVNRMKNQVLVQLSEDKNPSNWDFHELRASSSLQPKELISRHLNIWLMEFDEEATSLLDLIESLRANTDVIEAQANHKITYRKVEPDDTDYSKQWQYHNAGVTAGDIGIEEAWEYTTGGNTEKGDTIVLAIIDDGFDLNHKDFGDNVWTNRHEIPGNNIDDDGNGYKDDVRGWNADRNNDDIGQGGGHGTPVTGICGAKGNNGLGVAGVNWTVKLMVIIGGGNEAEAIKAYSYALENRKLYNETKGEKGAFVVGTNASWGIDGGKAEDAPLWCSFYDTLGEQGVLSAGATANNDVDVDTEGDLPTQCSSEYLIAVTNQGEDGKKVQSSGSGIKSIDLGAPGAGTWTAAKGNTYAGFGGTSGATPHVTGAIGLLYSSPCLQFATDAIDKPAETALKVRKYILDGTVANPTMEGKTVTGGSLNVHNSILELLKDYDCTVSINDKDKELAAFGFPNPVNNVYNLKILNSENDKFTLKLFDPLGREILVNYTTSANNLIEISTSFLNPGIYMLHVKSANGTLVKKLIKE